MKVDRLRKWKVLKVSKGVATILVSGKEYLVDAIYLPLLNEYHLKHFRGYLYCVDKRLHKDGKRHGFAFYRLIIGLFIVTEGIVADHINGDKFDNRRVNLRAVTTGDNLRNKAKVAKTASAKYKGVYLSNKGRWYARLCHKYKTVWGGLYDDETEATKAYDRIARDTLGAEGCFNFPKRGERQAVLYPTLERKDTYSLNK